MQSTRCTSNHLPTLALTLTLTLTLSLSLTAHLSPFTPSLTLCRYALHINDLRLQGRWDEKGVYLFYLDLLTDLFHMLV